MVLLMARDNHLLRERVVLFVLRILPEDILHVAICLPLTWILDWSLREGGYGWHRSNRYSSSNLVAVIFSYGRLIISSLSLLFLGTLIRAIQSVKVRPSDRVVRL